MRLVNFKLTDGYIFELDFEDGTHNIVDLAPLIKTKVKSEELKSAKVDKDWGCLELNLQIQPDITIAQETRYCGVKY